MGLLNAIGRMLGRYLTRPRPSRHSFATCTSERLFETIRPGDVLLVEGTSRVSESIKYLTQSTWSHAALYAGDRLQFLAGVEGSDLLIEADLLEGVRVLPLSEYAGEHTRICRPVGLVPSDIDRVIVYMGERLGHEYDIKNIVDLARYLIRRPPVPREYRRRMLALGSGDPTRSICSSLIAQAFQSIRYPILPEVVSREEGGPASGLEREILHIRHHSLFAPRDFDISPYFRVVKATIATGFDPYSLEWSGARGE